MGVPAAAPWPELVGLCGLSDLVHDSTNKKHRKMKEPTRNSPRGF